MSEVNNQKGSEEMDEEIYDEVYEDAKKLSRSFKDQGFSYDDVAIKRARYLNLGPDTKHTVSRKGVKRW